MNNDRIKEMRKKLESYRNGIATTLIRKAPDAELTEQGLCTKFVYELLDVLDTPNVKGERRLPGTVLPNERNP